MNSLFQPLKTAQLQIPNRVLMAPMTRNRALDGVPSELHALYYQQRAGAGLIVTEATFSEPLGRGYPGEPGLYSAAEIGGWKRVTSRVHAAGGKIFVQLHHAGRLSHPALLPFGADPVAPSAVTAQGALHLADGAAVPFTQPRPLKHDEILETIAEFGRAAGRAMEAGFDGVEIHGANGYLQHQFLGSNTNHRKDEWGGTVINRTRFLLETVGAAVASIGAERVGVKLSPGGFPAMDLQEEESQVTYAYIAQQLARHGLAYVHVQQPILNWGMEPLSFDPIVHFRRYFGGTVFAGGGFTAETAARLVDSGAADAVFFGRAFVANPDLPRRLALGAPLAEADPGTFYTPGEKGYADYPSLEQLSVAS